MEVLADLLGDPGRDVRPVVALVCVPQHRDCARRLGPRAEASPGLPHGYSRSSADDGGAGGSPHACREDADDSCERREA